MLLDSWDGESFIVKADGVQVYSLAHTCPTTASGGKNTCGRMDSGWNDVYKTITFGFNHTASTLTLLFSSTLDQDRNDESWGICNLTVTASPDAVDSTGKDLPFISDKVRTFFSSSTNVQREDSWTYNQGFRTINCSNNTYLGPYGYGGVVTSSAMPVGIHNGILVSFNLAFIDSWESEAFRIYADGVSVFYKTWYYASSSSSNTCQNSWNDAYTSITFGFNHSASTVTFRITSDLNEGYDNEGWGISDLAISASPNALNAAGEALVTENLVNKLTYFACASNVISSLWVYNQGYNTTRCSASGYSGAFLAYGQGGVVTSPKFLIGYHLGLVVSFKLAFIDSWEGESFQVTADNTVIYNASWNVNSSTIARSCGSNTWNDAYTTVTVGFNHSADSVTFVLSSTLDESIDNEAWGVCDFTITVTQNVVKADGTPITTTDLDDKPLTYFPCASPIDTGIWTYSQLYNTIKCGNDTYLAYGRGGLATSPKFNLGAHLGLIVAFKVAFIDSWESETFLVRADGTTIYSRAWASSRNPTLNTCQSASWNDTYTDISIGLNHTAASVTFTLTSNLDEPSDNEAWGVCDFTVATSPNVVTAAGVPITTANLTSKLTYFPCTNPVDPGVWTYAQGYSTIKCGTNTFLYYGQGGNVTSPTFYIGAHQALIVSFKLTLIDSWEGETFRVTADNTTIYSKAWNSALSTSQTCQSLDWNDAIIDVTVGLNHTTPSVTFYFSSTLDQDKSDEAWGICDFTVTASQLPVIADGQQMASVNLTKTATYFSCSSPANTPLWIYSQPYNTIRCGSGSAYLAYGQGGSVISPKFLIDDHQGLVVSFNLAFIDSWEGETFQVTLDGATVYSQSWHVASSPSQSCQSANWKDAYTSVTVGFNHSADSAIFTITSTLDETSDNEAWGICDFTVTTSQYPVLADGTRAPIIINETARNFFPCVKAVNDEAWTYNQGYATIKCNGNNYLGPYGYYGAVTSPNFLLGVHNGIIVSLQLAFIDTWENEYFRITADGVLVYSKNWYYPYSPNNTCQSGWNDMYTPVSFGFNHTASSLVFVLTSTLDEPYYNEAWGVCDFTVSASKYAVSAAGVELPAENLTDKLTYFACASNSISYMWQYNQGYKTIKCNNGNTYLAYGQGGVATSPKINIGTHQGLIVSFKLALIDSWEGETFKVTADNTTIYSVKYNKTQSTSNLCQSLSWNDASTSVTIGLNHTADSITFTISSTLNQISDIEAWGICDFTIATSQTVVTPAGVPINTANLTTSLTYFSCANPANTGIWTYSQGYNTIKCGNDSYLAYGKGGVVTSPRFLIDTIHYGIIVSFKLAFIDSWDGETFRITADGNTVYTLNYHKNQSTSNTCQSASWNDAYMTVSFGFNHTSNSVTFVITSTLDQPADDEAWGVCDFTVTLSTKHQVHANGTQIDSQTVLNKPSIWFACSSPSIDALWAYVPAYNTIKCNGNNYLGPFGQGGSVTSPRLKVDNNHKGFAVSFKVAFMDTWESETFQISADGKIVYNTTWNYATQSSSNTCQSAWGDGYKTVTFGFNHSAPNLILAITSTLNEPSTNEAWGICDFIIMPTTELIFFNGTLIPTLHDVPSTWWSCINPPNDQSWKYSAGFSVFQCMGSGYTYVGPYGAKATITSPTFAVVDHLGFIVSFKMVLADSWENETFKITADGVVVYNFTENQTQAGPSSCQYGWSDDYDFVTFGFNHSAPSVTFVISSTLDQSASDESWGICDFTVTASQYYVTQSGALISNPVTTGNTSKIIAAVELPAVNLTGTDLKKWIVNDTSGVIANFISSGFKFNIRNASFSNGTIHTTVDAYGYTSTSTQPIWDSGLAMDIIISNTTVSSIEILNDSLLDQAELKYFLNAWANNSAIPYLSTKSPSQ